MAKSKKILIAVDGSPHSLNAVRYVALNCTPADLQVNLMYVMPTAPETFWDLEKEVYFQQKMKAKYAQWKRDAKNAAQAFLDEATDLLVKANVPKDHVGVMLQERKVGVARDIVAESQRDYDGVVVGRRGLSKLQDLFLGSVSNKIVQAVEKTPVLVVGGDIRSKKVLLAVDGSENSRKAVDYLASFVGGTASEITLYHVVRRVELGRADDVTSRIAEVEDEQEEHVRQNVEKMFRAYRQFLERAGVEPARINSKCTTLSYSRAGDILREANEGDYGTIVMGRRGHSEVWQFIMGRVTDKVLTRAEGFAVWIVP
jgi:nucleotide-binding universal stress UspA family protein